MRDEIATVDMMLRSIVEELILDDEFLVKRNLVEVLDLLKFQKWDNVVDDLLVKKFYSSLSVDMKGKGLVGTYPREGVPKAVTSAYLAAALGVSHDGYADYCGRAWPEGMNGDVVMKDVNGDPFPGKTVSTNRMSPATRLLDSFVLKNIVPRSEKGSILDKILKK